MKCKGNAHFSQQELKILRSFIQMHHLVTKGTRRRTKDRNREKAAPPNRPGLGRGGRAGSRCIGDDERRQGSWGPTDWQQEGIWGTCFSSWPTGWEVLSFCIALTSLAYRAGRWASGPGARLGQR